MPSAPPQQHQKLQLETIVALALAVLLLQLMPPGFWAGVSVIWDAGRGVLDQILLALDVRIWLRTILAALDVRTWSRAHWMVANLLVILALLGIRVIPKVKKAWTARRTRAAQQCEAVEKARHARQSREMREGIEAGRRRRIF